MNSVSCIQGPPSPPPSLHYASTQGTSKSKFRSLFHRRKPSTGSLRPSTRAGHEPMPSLPFSTSSIPRPGLSPRSYSDYPHFSHPDRPRSADNKLSRKRDRVVNDPPPLAQAYGQALLHAELETPTSFIEKSRHGILAARDHHAGYFSEDTIEVKRSHKKTDSGESMCSTQGKMFFLINGPYVLQYDGDSNGDALPEKILILDRNSVAVACDAVPGRPWVLQISKPHITTAKGHGQSLRPSWSKMALRQAEDRRVVNTLLLVFNDSDELYTWLIAMRKEIENLGGLEYRPDGEDDQAWRENLAQKFGSAPVSRKPSTARTSSTHASPAPPARRGVPPRATPHSNRSSVSSKQTSTSLDRFRDSVASDGYTSTLATSCADGSASSPSPIYEAFPSIKYVTDHASGDLSLRSYTRSNETSPKVSTSPKPSRTLFERRKLSVSSLSLAGQEDTKDRGRKFLLDLPSTISASPDEPPKVTASMAPDTSDSKNAACVDGAVEKNRPIRGDSLKKQMVRQPSAAESASSGRKAKYSLFPACPPTETKDEPLVDPSAFLQPLSIPKIIESHHDSKSRTYPGTEIRHHKSGSRTVTLELRQHRVSALLGAGEFSQAQRSPAVTDDMIMANFGIVRNEPPASPMPEIRVPGLSDLGFDMDFLRTPYTAPSKNRSPAPRDRRTSSTRSISSSRHEMSTTLAKAPVGPPPAGPLPAVPMGGRQSFQTNRSSHQSQRSQSRKSDQHIIEEVQESEHTLYSTQLSMSPKGERVSEGDRQYRRRTKSNSTNGPALYNTTSNNNYEPASHSRSRSQSRGRRRSGKNV